MGGKEKLVGILLLVIGAYPLLLKVKSISDSLAQYTFLTYLSPDGFVYPIVILILGVLLLYTPRPRSPYPYPPRR